MKVMIVWTSHPGTHEEALRKFTAEGGIKTPPGVRILNQSIAIGCGFILLESDDYGAVASFCSDWQAVVSMEPHIVIDHAQLLEHHKQRLHKGRA